MPEITDEDLAALQAKAALADQLAPQVEHLTAQVAETEPLRAQVRDATEAARAAIIAANPTIPADLIKGESITDINQSLAAAQAIANRLAEAAGKGPLGFPTGGTQRQPAAAPEGIHGAERIRWALNNKE
jgi:hypothetical protein